MAQVGAHDIFDVVLIDTGNAVQKGTECMCPAAFMAAETADAQPDDAARGLQTTHVIKRRKPRIDDGRSLTLDGWGSCFFNRVTKV